MKAQKHLIAIIIALASIVAAKAQTWLLGGNPFNGPNGTSISNFHGTAGGNNNPIVFGTNGTTRMTILGNGGGTNGFVGIGMNFPTPLWILDVRNGDVNVGNGVAGNVPNSNFGYRIGGNYVLWHNGNVNNIFVGVGAGLANTFGTDNTFVGNGAGSGNTNANRNTVMGFHALQGATGRSNTAIGYRALHDNTGVENTAVGADAMFSAAANFVQQNTAVGFEALKADVVGAQQTAIGWHALRFTTGAGAGGTLGQENTSVGSQALEMNDLGWKNSALGDDALAANTSGSFNTAIGSEALGKNITGSSNTGIGQRALLHNFGRRNTALGDSAGANNQNGDRNTFGGYYAGLGNGLNSFADNSFFGYQSGVNITSGTGNTFMGLLSGTSLSTGSLNTIIGTKADLSLGNLKNAAAIGANAITVADNKMILGDNSVNVGIGLSNDPAPPANELEINIPAAVTKTTPNLYAPGTGFSGLRFRDLTTASTPSPNQFTIPAVLSVDVNGDVILVPDGTGTINTNNGITVAGGVVQLGASCLHSTLAQKLQAALTDDRVIGLNTHALVFADGAGNPPAGRIGIGDISNCNVNNTLEIGANAASVNYPPAGGASGLRLTHLTSANTPIAPGTFGVINTKVLTVDQNGDVVLVTPAGGGLGGVCNTSPTGLSNNWEVPLNNWNYIFSGQGTTNYNVGIGTGCSPAAKLEVYQNSSTPNSLGVLTTNIDPDGVALKALAFGTPSSQQTKVAGWFESPGAGGLQNYGQVAIFVPQQGGVVNIGFPAPNAVAQGTWAGLVNVNGTIATLNGGVQMSDSSMKHNIQTIDSGLDKIVHLRPVTFEWDTLRDSLMAGTRAGFIAQEVNRVIPQVVHHIGNTQAIAYMEIMPYIVKGMQQQQLSIDSLRNNPAAGSSLGNICGGTQNPLTDNYEIPLGGHNINFTDSVNSTSKITIGYPTCQFFKARFNVFSDNIFVGSSVSNSTNSTRPTYGSVVFNANNSGDANGVNTSVSTGSGFNATAITGFASSACVQNIGLNGNASNATTNYGVYASATGGTTNYAGYFNGDVIRTGSDNFTSDANLKQNIDTIPNALNTIMQLKPKTFTYKQSSYPSMNLPAGKQYGLIAQEVQPLLPELINNTIHPSVKDSLGNVITPAVNYLSLEYQQLTAIMIKAMQQQQAQIDSMKAILASCCSNNSRTTQNNTAIDVELSDADIVVLNQNSPNPFAEQTTITYTIPKNTGAAQILFYDINGRQIKTVDITKKGKGQLNVYANDLTNGIYSYTLIVDGKIIDTKKMLKQQ